MADKCNSCGQTIKKPREAKLVVRKFDTDDMALAEYLYDLVGKNFEFLKDKEVTTKEYEEMNKLRRIDNRNFETIQFIIRWCQQDDFWCKNIRSVSKLRKQFDTLMVHAKSDISKRTNVVVSV